MSNQYILGIDQSTAGTKALLFDQEGKLLGRSDLSHQQIINDQGWVEHNPEEIYHNAITVVTKLIEQLKIDKHDIVGIGISNQRETALAWDNLTGIPIYNAIVWQCARGEAICNQLSQAGFGEMIQAHTGLHLSPYFSAAKIAWILQNVDGAKEKSIQGELCYGTIDSWLIFKLTKGKQFKTDYSNASRTQLFNINSLEWDIEICKLFGINQACLPRVCDSNAYYGETDLDGFLDKSIPIHGVLGDSHAALFGQGCIQPGMVKSTYGTGSSVMMNIGDKPIFSEKGIVTSLAWGMNGEVHYVLEGNINYTGAVIKWLQEDLGLINSADETETLAEEANQQDKTYIIPAFTGLSAPYWNSKATGTITGMSRTTGRAEIVKAALECIAYQITDIIAVMKEDAGIAMKELRVDGGPTRNRYLMQFQSDMLGSLVSVPNVEELSGIGAAYTAGIALNILDKDKVFSNITRKQFNPSMEKVIKNAKYEQWKKAIAMVCNGLST